MFMSAVRLESSAPDMPAARRQSRLAVRYGSELWLSHWQFLVPTEYYERPHRLTQASDVRHSIDVLYRL